MHRQGFMAFTAVAALGAALVAVVPASGAPDSRPKVRTARATPSGGFGYFTPASADPRLAAIFARGGLSNRGLRFTPVAFGKARKVTVAVRAETTRRLASSAVPRRPAPQALAEAPVTNVGIQPVSYNLGASVGWKRFALSGDVAKVENGIVPGGREKAGVGVSYNSRKWNSRVAVGAERPISGSAPVRGLNGVESYSVDVAGSYRLTRNLDVTAGVRYRQDRDRLQPELDQRRDSQAVYVGTAFRF